MVFVGDVSKLNISGFTVCQRSKKKKKNSLRGEYTKIDQAWQIILYKLTRTGVEGSLMDFYKHKNVFSNDWTPRLGFHGLLPIFSSTKRRSQPPWKILYNINNNYRVALPILVLVGKNHQQMFSREVFRIQKSWIIFAVFLYIFKRFTIKIQFLNLKKKKNPAGVQLNTL